MTHNRRGMKSAAPRASRSTGGWVGVVCPCPCRAALSAPAGPSRGGWLRLSFLLVPSQREGGFPSLPRFFSRTCRGAARRHGRNGTGLTPVLQNPPPEWLPVLAGEPPAFQVIINSFLKLHNNASNSNKQKTTPKFNNNNPPPPTQQTKRK